VSPGATRSPRRRGSLALVALVASCALLVPAALEAQRPPATRGLDPAVARFVADARSGTARYRDQETAISEGFRRVGTDFPGMGEHWVSLERIMADSFAAARPSVLTYADVGGVPTLVGVAYTAVLEPGERPPSFAPARAFWHEHNGSVDEESFPLAHHAAGLGAAPHGSEPPMRLAVLHAWVWDANPAGLFVADNWALPLTRLGVARRAAVTPSGLGAIALALGAHDFYAQAIRSGAALSPAEEDAAERVLGRYRKEIERALSEPRARGRLTPGDARRLDALWSAMWGDLERAAPGRAARIRQVGASPTLTGAAPATR
jgi:hypothetical protein